MTEKIGNLKGDGAGCLQKFLQRNVASLEGPGDLTYLERFSLALMKKS
jgi:hypothetical protein